MLAQTIVLCSRDDAEPVGDELVGDGSGGDLARAVAAGR